MRVLERRRDAFRDQSAYSAGMRMPYARTRASIASSVHPEVSSHVMNGNAVDDVEEGAVDDGGMREGAPGGVLADRRLDRFGGQLARAKDAQANEPAFVGGVERAEDRAEGVVGERRYEQVVAEVAGQLGRGVAHRTIFSGEGSRLTTSFRLCTVVTCRRSK